MAGRHDWRTREEYFSIHFKILRFFEPYMSPPVQYKHEVITENYEILEAPRIVFTTWTRHTVVHVKIRKEVIIRRNPGMRPEAKTFSYRYHANLPDGRALLRYCSPDDPTNPVDPKNHHTFHHKHIFDNLGNETKVINSETPPGEWPQVGNFLNELLQNF
jgi:hypothetical protein